jgi:glycosyltransferase involved in cell wall biosynthesis
VGSFWLDVTTIYRWKRPAVGIVRVEVECAKYALLNPDINIKFCIFEGKIGYRAVQPAAVFNIIKDITECASGDVSNVYNRWNSSFSFLKNSKSSFIRSLWALTYESCVQVNDYFSSKKEHLDTAFRGARYLKRGLLGFLHSFVPKWCTGACFFQLACFQKKQVLFLKDDVYISLGADWENKDLGYIYREKQRVGFKTLLICYDLIPVLFPHLCASDISDRFAKYYIELSRCADIILCISENTKRDLTNFLNSRSIKPTTKIIRLGCSLHDVQNDMSPGLEISDLVKGPYILFVSTIERRKNHETIYRAYCKLIDQGEEDLPRLVFVGMCGWGVSDFMLDLKLDTRIRKYLCVLNNINDVDLVALYKYALFTVYPSLYEGWGLPVAESLAFGKFCLASSTSSIPEIAKDLIEYIDPWDVLRWAERILYYAKNREALEHKNRDILNGYESTSWSDTAFSIFNFAGEVVQYVNRD